MGQISRRKAATNACIASCITTPLEVLLVYQVLVSQLTGKDCQSHDKNYAYSSENIFSRASL